MFRNAVLAVALALAGLLWTSAAPAADMALSTQWVTYGQQLYAQRQYDQAIKAFSTAARANSSNEAAWKGLGNSLYAKRDYTNALKYYRYALQLNPSDNQLAVFVQRLASTSAQGSSASDPSTLAGRYYSAGQYDYAIYEYKAAVAASPNNAKAYQGLGNCYYAKQDKPDAVAAYKRSLQIDDSNVSLKAFLARYSPQDAQAAGVQVASGPADWPQPLWRSAILPGWGQGYNGEDTKGWIIGTLTIGSLIGTVGTYIVGSNARSTYNGYGPSTLNGGTVSPGQFTTAYNTWNTMATVNNVLAITFLALYTFNLVDAIMGAKPATTAMGLMPDPNKPLQVGMLDNGTMGAKVRLMDF
jgi:tetratricopeptide (TPR) repeat protein